MINIHNSIWAELSIEIGMVRNSHDDVSSAIKLRIFGNLQELRELFPKLHCGGKYAVDGITFHRVENNVYNAQGDTTRSTLKRIPGTGTEMSIIGSVKSRNIRRAFVVTPVETSMCFVWQRPSNLTGLDWQI